ncbi:InlB B-repeat-containing protein [Candidatus Saccharibacteria bacterium]|nr:InlB B-repeat-containing protein [Candidatus Saccharibacteria bacterium]
MSVKSSIYNIYSRASQASKSTSSKKMRTKRDIVSHPPYSEFPAATGTFTGLAVSLLIGLFGAANTYATESYINITLSGNVKLDLARSGTSTSYGESSAQTATVKTNHFTGYSFTIAAENNDTRRLVGTNDNTKYLDSITTAMPKTDFNTSANNNKWAFIPDHLHNGTTTVENTNYQPGPLKTTPTIIDKPTSPNEDGRKYKLAIGARIDNTMSLDSYGQTFILAATGNGYDYNISYKDPMDDLPAAQSGNEQTDHTAISSDTPTRDGYYFAGWCTESTMTTDCPGETYYPGDDYYFSATNANNIILYAMWTPRDETFDAVFAAAGKTKTNGYYAMQDMTSNICNSVAKGSTGTLIDTRNNKTYAVAKYLDDHCWMRENLNYVFTENGTVEAYNFQSGEIFNYTTPLATQTSTGTAWPQDASDGARSFARDENKFIGGTNIATAGTTMNTGQPYERIGVLYNWAAATAQTGEQAAAAGASGDQVIPTSICPKGWRLPANSGDYSFSTLMGSYGLPTTGQSQGYSGQLQNPLNFNRPGNYDWSTGALYSRGTGGWFWSSVGYSTTSAHYFSFHSTGFYPQSGASKGNGFSVRCVAV